VVPALAISAGVIATAASGLTGHWEWLALWFAGLTMFTIGIAIRKRSLKRGVFTLFQRLLVLEGTIRGLLLKPFDPTGYPGSYEVITDFSSTAGLSVDAKFALCFRLHRSDRQVPSVSTGKSACPSSESLYSKGSD
jgi:hypothetical protein